MASTAQGKRYAQAVFQIAQQNNDLDKWLSDLKALTEMERNSIFIQALETPNLTFEDKEKLLRDRYPNIGPLAINLVKLLIEKRRLRLLPGIYTEFQNLFDANRGVIRAEVITAVELNEEYKQYLADRLSKITGKKMTIDTKVDPSIIGGMIARFESKLLDASTRSRLEALKQEISRTPR